MPTDKQSESEISENFDNLEVEPDGDFDNENEEYSLNNEEDF
jgi:hypothetical protein